MITPNNYDEYSKDVKVASWEPEHPYNWSHISDAQELDGGSNLVMAVWGEVPFK